MAPKLPSFLNRVHISTFPGKGWPGQGVSESLIEDGPQDWKLHFKGIQMPHSILGQKFWMVIFHFQSPFLFCLKRSFLLLMGAVLSQGLLWVSAFNIHC